MPIRVPMMMCGDCSKRHSTLAAACPFCGRPNADEASQPPSFGGVETGTESRRPDTRAEAGASAELAEREAEAKRMRLGLGLLLVGVVGAFFIIVGNHGQAAQQRDAAERPAADTSVPAMVPASPLPDPHSGWKVSGFDGLPWSTPLATVKTHRPNSISEQTGPEGLTIYVTQTDDLAGRRAQAVYIVSPTAGLTGGGFMLFFSGDETFLTDCAQTLHDLRRLVRQRYPDLVLLSENNGQRCRLDTKLLWKDRTSGSQIAISIESRLAALQLTYIAPNSLIDEIARAKGRAAAEEQARSANVEASQSRL